MKYLIVLALLVPLWAQAQGKDRISETEQTIIKDNDTVTVERRTYTKEGDREAFQECDRYQWKTQWGVHNQISCDNWTERQAMNDTLTYAPNGVKVEWRDNQRRERGYFVVIWTRPPTQSGMCRDIVRVRYSGNVPESDNYIMCYNNGRGWQAFKGN